MNHRFKFAMALTKEMTFAPFDRGEIFLFIHSF